MHMSKEKVRYLSPYLVSESYLGLYFPNSGAPFPTWSSLLKIISLWSLVWDLKFYVHVLLALIATKFLSILRVAAYTFIASLLIFLSSSAFCFSSCLLFLISAKYCSISFIVYLKVCHFISHLQWSLRFWASCPSAPSAHQALHRQSSWATSAFSSFGILRSWNQDCAWGSLPPHAYSWPLNWKLCTYSLWSCRPLKTWADLSPDPCRNRP